MNIKSHICTTKIENSLMRNAQMQGYTDWVQENAQRVCCGNLICGKYTGYAKKSLQF
jgi:hypothetical protein